MCCDGKETFSLYVSSRTMAYVVMVTSVYALLINDRAMKPPSYKNYSKSVYLLKVF